MDFVVTVHPPGSAGPGVDLRLRAERPVTVAEFSDLVADQLGMPRAHLALAGSPLDLGHLCGRWPVVHGASLTASPEPVAASPPMGSRGTTARGTPDARRPADTRPRNAATVFDLVIAGGPDCGQRIVLPPTGLSIGRDGTCDVPLGDPLLSRAHARVSVGVAGVHVHDLGSTNGVRVRRGSVEEEVRGLEGVRIDRASSVRLGSTTVRLRRADVQSRPTPAPRVPNDADPEVDGHLSVTRTLRTRAPQPRLDLTRPAAPEAVEGMPLPWITMLVPVPIALVLAWMFGPQFMLFALMGPVMMGATWWHERRQRTRRGSVSSADHEASLTIHRRSLDDALATEGAWLEAHWPDPEQVLATAMTAGPDLWTVSAQATPAHPRSPESPTAQAISSRAMRLRLGRGDPLSQNITVRVGSADLEQPVLRDAPVVVDCAAGVLFVVGSDDRRRRVLRQLVGQLATQHSPAELEIVVVGARDGQWQWTRWLPHVQEGPIRASSSEAPTAPTAASTLAAGLADGVKGHRLASRHLLVVLPDADAPADDTRTAGALSPDALRRWCDAANGDVRITVLAGLRTPPHREGVLLSLRDDGDLLVVGAERTPLVADGVGAWWAERLARALAPLRPNGWSPPTQGHRSPWEAVGWARSASPSAPTLTHLVREAWARTGIATATANATDHERPARTTVGVSEGRPWTVDLDRDGPHVLIGGTTGSGKSEALRAFIGGLALTCSPRDVTFLLIDYKGGSTFVECQRLPHTVGVVNDLDRRLADRALRSLRAEIHRRERVLAEAAAIDRADLARRDPDAAMPRLVVVVDEFRVLAQEHPAFLDGLVRLAAVGRSMGIHLVLATQRPAGAITPDIQANVNLRIALRMRDPQDSEQVIASPEAARLSPHEPGTGIARSGDGQLTRFRAFHLGRPILEAPEVSVTRVGDQPAHLTSGGAGAQPPTEESLLVSAVRAAYESSGEPPPRRPWLPPLPEQLTARALPTDGTYGCTDHPDDQTQGWLRWTPGPQPLRIVGGRRSGRTTALAGIITQLAKARPADELQVYAVCSGPALTALAALPNAGAVVTLDEPGRLQRLVALLDRLSRPGREDCPHTVVVIDDWDQVMAPDQARSAHLEAVVRALSSAGQHVSVIAAGGRGLMSSRVLTGGDLLLLGGLEPSDLLVHGIRPTHAPDPWPAGRGVRAADGVEFQVARPEDPGSVRALSRRRPEPVLDLPQTVSLDDLTGDVTAERANEHDERAEHGPFVLGLGDVPGLVTWDPGASGSSLLVVGESGSGRSTTLASLAGQAASRGVPVVVVSARDESCWPERALPPRELDPAALRELVTVDGATSPAGVMLLVDDAESLGADLESAIAALLDGGGVRVVAAARLHTLGSAFRGLVPQLAQRGTAVLLNPSSPRDGDAFGLRLEPPATRCPGRGLFIDRGRSLELQVALPGAEATPGEGRVVAVRSARHT